MKGFKMKKIKFLISGLAITGMVLFSGYGSAKDIENESSIDTQTLAEYFLPLPRSVDMILEESISRRKSHRIFTEETVSDEALSTVLWSAYGIRDDGTRTVEAVDTLHATVIYVLKEDAAYKYNPINHALVFYKEGDYRIHLKNYPSIYMAPIQFVLCLDIDTGNFFRTSVEIGEIGQTILLTSVALGLGSVVTAQSPVTMAPIGLPENELAIVVIPLGHLETPYEFSNQPYRFSMLDKTVFSDMSLSTALQQREETSSLGGTLFWQEKSQIIWASYGFSPLRDKQLNFIYLPRHRTVPSPHLTYDAITMYAVMEDGIYRYIALGNLRIPGEPVFDFLIKVVDGDQRGALAKACSKPALAAAPLSIISVMDIEKTTSEEYYWAYWYFVAGASAQNILLEATALNLFGDITFPPDPDAILSLLELRAQVFQPLLVVSVGSEAY